MDKTIYFIDDSESFIVTSIMKNLENLGHSCQIIEWDVDAIADYADQFSDIMIGYIDDVDELDQDALKKVLDICAGNEHNLYLVGHEEDIKEIESAAPSNAIAGSFLRPINATDVADQIAHMSGNNPIKLRKHILVVDDSGTMLTTIQEWLGDKYRVSLVNSAMNAIAFLGKSIPDLILLDYEMPGCSGPQLLEMLRADERTASIPIIFLTGMNDKESVKRVLMQKPAGYLLKNMPKEHIIGQVDAFFEKQQG